MEAYMEDAQSGRIIEVEDKLTPEQIQNWRRMLPILFGLPMSFGDDAHIQKLRNGFQALADKTIDKQEEKPTQEPTQELPRMINKPRIIERKGNKR